MALKPLEELIVGRFLEFLPKQTYPIQNGVHSNTAFGMLLALEYAELMALDHTAIGDDFFRRVREEFRDAEIVELTMAIGQYLGFGRFLHVLEVVRPVCDL